MGDTTAFITLSDANYLTKAYRTIKDLRGRGKWSGCIVLCCVDCTADPGFLETYSVKEYRLTHLNTDEHVARLKKNPIRPMADNRHFGKLTQWDKLQVFTPYFKQWDRIVFLDAGLRVLDSVDALLSLEWHGKLVAPNDVGPYDNGNRFQCQVDLEANPDATCLFFEEFSTDILKEMYFMNCMFLFDTELITDTTYTELLDYMEKFPIMLCNEMGTMNLYWTFVKKVWSMFPEKINDKYLYQWSELCYTHPRPDWRSFYFLKYPATIRMDQD